MKNIEYLTGAHTKNIVFGVHRGLAWLLALAFSSTALAPLMHAGEAQVAVRVYAQDSSINASGSQSVSTPASFHPVANATAMYTAGLARGYGYVDASTYTGAIHADFQAAVDDTRFVIGRGANTSGSGSMTGSITLSAGHPPGLATFSAVLEGSYNFSNSIFNFNNSISLDYAASVGDGPERSGNLSFRDVPATTAGLFSVPLTWTQMVHPGDRIDMSFYLHASVTSGVDAVELNALNTFKLTAIDLPEGYTYTPDAEGFLSQFQQPTTEPPVTSTAVPEPATGMLMGSVILFGLALIRHRRRGTLNRGAQI